MTKTENLIAFHTEPFDKYIKLTVGNRYTFFKDVKNGVVTYTCHYPNMLVLDEKQFIKHFRLQGEEDKIPGTDYYFGTLLFVKHPNGKVERICVSRSNFDETCTHSFEVTNLLPSLGKIRVWYPFEDESGKLDSFLWDIFGPFEDGDEFGGITRHGRKFMLKKEGAEELLKSFKNPFFSDKVIFNEDYIEGISISDYIRIIEKYLSR